jgi:PAS domain S-box-containing protein
MQKISLTASRRRLPAMVAIVLVAIAGAAAGHWSGTIDLRPLATLCVVAFALFTELPAGIIFAVLLSIVYSATGSTGPGGAAGIADFALFTVIDVLAAIIASAIKVHTARQKVADIALERSALQEYEQRYLSVGEIIPFGTWHTRPDDKLYMSQSFLDLVGMTIDEIQNGGWVTRVVPEDAQRFLEAWERRDQSDGSWEQEYRIRGADEKVYSILSRGTRLNGADGETLGWVGVSFDITIRKRAEERLEFLAEAGRLLALSLDPETTLGRIAALCVPKLADWCTVDLLSEEGQLNLVVINHRNPERVAMARELRLEYPPSDDDDIQRAVRGGSPLIVDDVKNPRIAAAPRDDRHLGLLRELELTSLMYVPLIARGKTLGAVTFVSAESKRRYDSNDLEFAEILCRRAALAYDNARLFAREQRVAEALQTASLPTSLPEIPGVRISATYRAGAKESEIGGDWYDAFELPDGDLALSVGDVAGKGLKAAVAMGAVRQAIRAASFEGASPAEVLNRANRLLCHQNIGMVTAAIGILHIDTRLFTFSTAGHPPILTIRQNEDLRLLTTEGLPLGVLPEYIFTQDSTILDRGSLLVMYTDGLLENTRNVKEGELALAGAVRHELASPSQNAADSIVARVLTSNPTDDVAALTVEISPDSFDRFDMTVAAEPESARMIRRGLRRLCRAAGLTEKRTMNMLVASGEAVSNAIQHAYGVEGGTVSVHAYRVSGTLVVEIGDTGRWRVERQDGHGRGITLMRKLVDAVSIQSAAHGTAVVLRIADGPSV